MLNCQRGIRFDSFLYNRKGYLDIRKGMRRTKVLINFLLFVSLILWCQEYFILHHFIHVKADVIGESVESIDQTSDASASSEDEDEDEEDETVNDGDYVFIVYGKKNISALLIRGDLAASVQVDNVKYLCQMDLCEPTSLEKEYNVFSFWDVAEDRKPPLQFDFDEYVMAKCTANYNLKKIQIYNFTDPYIECKPQCHHGDVILCNSQAAGIVMLNTSDNMLRLRNIDYLVTAYLGREGAKKTQVPKGADPAYAKEDSQDTAEEDTLAKIRNQDDEPSSAMRIIAIFTSVCILTLLIL